MSVALDPPSQLIFKRPLTQPIEEILYVKNVGNEPLAFKVKTTAPKKYCVRPNSIVFQPFREEPPPDYKCKDKFLVQTAVVKPEWLDWNMIELVKRYRN
ncbi:PapD-like protein [Cunninghamella echinulata]|nr:PapD-like protein [Cunninghamella echinulata]